MISNCMARGGANVCFATLGKVEIWEIGNFANLGICMPHLATQATILCARKCAGLLRLCSVRLGGGEAQGAIFQHLSCAADMFRALSCPNQKHRTTHNHLRNAFVMRTVPGMHK